MHIVIDFTTLHTSHYRNVPFEVPEGWVWTRLGEICDYGICNNVAPTDISEDAWILDLEDIEKDSAKLLCRVRKINRCTTSVRHSFSKGDVLYSKLRTYLNKVLIADTDGYCSSEILPLDFRGFVIPEYARHVLMSKMFLDYTAQCGYGVKMPRLGTTDGRNALFPLPSLSEQHRIVSVIESAFAIIDEIDASKQDLTQIVKQAKSKVLDLAIRGKLVPQDPADEPASKLLERIKKEQKPTKISSDISHYPFDVPEGWVWCSLGEICTQITDGTHRTPKYTGNGIPFLRVTDITESNGSKKFISEEEHNELIKRCKPKKGDVLLSKNGTIGVAKVVDWDYDFSIFVSLCLLKPYEIVLNNQYLVFYLHSNSTSKQMKARGKTVTVTNLHLEEIKQLLIPLPPLTEQKRIVKRIETLFQTLDTISNNLQGTFMK